MSRSVDERIVDMQFNNSQFESGVKDSLDSLDKLKKGLNLDESSRSLNDLAETGKRFSLAGIADGVETIANRFTTFGLIGVTALQNITNAALEAGKNLISSLTIDPIMAGFHEYETQMNAVQTILANTQEGVGKVNQVTIDALKTSAVTATAAMKTSNADALSDFRDAQSKKVREAKKAADDEVRIIQDKHSKEKDDLDTAIQNENDALQKAHKVILDIYNEEYMQKLKAINEEKYNKIKALDDEINGLKGLTKAENDSLAVAQDKKTLEDLEKKVTFAKTIQKRKDAEQAVANFQDQMSRKALLKQRDSQISNLETAKDTVKTEYDLKKDQLKTDYDNKVKNENDIYSVTSKNLKDQENAKVKSLNYTYKTEKELMDARHASDREALTEKQNAEEKYFKQSQKTALSNITEKRDADIKALNDIANVKTKGSTLDDVNKALDQLNTYADKTIYNFTEMTKNIGTFTAAGVGLDTSVKAIKGIANLGALSGSNADQVSSAMYQLSQALASGKVKLQDWNSVVNAGIGGQVFQNALKETAKVHGVEVDKIIAKEGSFRESLDKGWLSSDILLETLNKFTGDMTTDQLKAIGYNEEQIKGILKLGQTANDAATKVKTFSQLIETLQEAVGSGWTNTFEILLGNFEEAKSLFTNISDVVGGFINETSKARNGMLQIWKDNGGRAALIQSLQNAFEAIVKIIKPISEAFREIFPATTGQDLVALTKGLLSFTESLKIGGETADKIKRTYAGFFAVWDIGKQAISAIVSGIIRLIKIMAPGTSNILDFSAGIGDLLVSFDNFLKKGDVFGKVIQVIGDVIEKVAKTVGGGISAMIGFFKQFGEINTSGIETFTGKVQASLSPFSKLFDGIGRIFSSIVNELKKTAPLFYKFTSLIGEALINMQERIMDAMNKGNFSSILDIVNTGLLGALLVGIKKFVNSMSSVTGGFAGILNGVKGSLEAWQSSLKAKVLLNIAIAIGILAVSLAVLAAIDPKRLAGALAAITTLFVDLFGSMAIFAKIMSSSGYTSMGKLTLSMMGISVAVLLLSFAMAKMAKLDWDGIKKGLTAVGGLLAMLVITAKLLSTNSASMIKGSAGIIAFAIAINILAIAVGKLGKLDTKTLGKGLLSVAILMTELALFMKATNLNQMGITKGVGIILLAVALEILAVAVKKLGDIDIKTLAKGLGAIAILLGEISLFLRVMPDTKRVISTALGLAILGGAMIVFAIAIEKMGNLSLDQIGKGLLTLSGALIAITVAMKLMPNNMISIGLGMLAISASLLILSKALSQMGNMSWEQIAKGLVVLAGSLLIIGVALKFMQTSLAGAAALLIVSFALTILAKVLKTLGDMSLIQIGIGLLALAGVFVVIGVAALVLAPLVPVILALGVAIGLLGIAILAIGGGLLLFSAGLAALAVSGAAGVAVFISIVTGLIGLIPFLFKQMGLAIIAFAGVIIDGMPVIVQAISVFFAGLIKIINDLMPPLIDTIMKFILQTLKKILEFLPQFIDTGSKIIIGFLQGISNNIADIVKAGIDVILNFLDGVRQKLPDIIDMAFKIIITLINGLADAIRKNHNLVYDACSNLITAIIESLTDLITKLPEVGANIVKGLIKGIASTGKELAAATKDVVGSSIEAIAKLLDMHSPSKVTEQMGVYMGQGMINGLYGISGKVGSASEDMGKTAVDSMSSALSHIQDLLDGNIDLQPTIRPVVDMTDVESGIKSSFANQQGLNVTATTNQVATVATQGQNGGISEGTNNTTNNSNDSKISFGPNYYTVRNDNDIRKISNDQRNLIDRYNLAKGVQVK
jgi:tape measure domain-containing protein